MKTCGIILFLAVCLQSCVTSSGFPHRKYLDGRWNERELKRFSISQKSDSESVTQSPVQFPIVMDSISEVCVEQECLPAVEPPFDIREKREAESPDRAIVSGLPGIIGMEQNFSVGPDPDADAGDAFSLATLCLAFLAGYLVTMIIPQLIYITVMALFTPLMFLGAVIYLAIYYVRIWSGVYVDSDPRLIYWTYAALAADILLAIFMWYKEILFWTPELKKKRKNRRARRRAFN